MIAMTEAAYNAYRDQLEKWLPGAELRAADDGVDATIHWRGPRKAVTYTVVHKANLEHQDVWAVAGQLHRQRTTGDTSPRLMVLAPFIRREQGAILEQNDIDYLDLAGNAHLRAPGVFVHVEGLRPAVKRPRTRHRMTRGWVKTVLALLVRPELVRQPYRPIAEAADVAPATVMACLANLKTAGLLRQEGGKRRLVNPRDLLALWIQAYAEVLRPKLAQRNFQMKLTDRTGRWKLLGEVLARHDIDWALTGADAALLVAPHLRTDRTEIYAPPGRFDEPGLLRELGIQPAVAGNLQVIEPPAPLAVQTRANQVEAPTAPLVLIYAELRCRHDDQANEAAEILLPQVLQRATA
jgi:hypothetical protein